MALGGNYLENMARRGSDDGGGGGGGGDNESDGGGNGGNGGWGGFFGAPRVGGAMGGVGRGARTAVRPAPGGDAPTMSSSSERGNYGIGGGGGRGGGNGGGGVAPRVVSIRQPQDLLDFVIQDERLSVGE